MFNSTDFTMPVVPAGYGGTGNGMFGGDGGWWGFIIILLLFGGLGRGGFGGFGGGYGEVPATQSDVRSAIDQQTLISKIDQQTYGLADSFTALNNALNSNFRGVDSAICNLGYQNQQGFNGLSAQLASCCCGIERGIDSVNFNAAQNTCAITNAIHAEGEETRKLIQQNEIQALRDKVSDLQLAQSQSTQNSYLINQLRPCPIPAYLTCSPYSNYGIYGTGNACGCGCA